MLSSVLPGIRSLRAPFAAGSLILAALYLAAYGPVHRATRGDRLGDGLESLLDLVGGRPGAVALSVAAYLVGTLYVAAVRRLMSQMGKRRVAGIANMAYVEADERSLLMALLAPFSRHSLRRVIGLCDREFSDPGLATKVCEEIITGVGKRLLVKNKDLYAEWDRMAAEAEFRDAVALPAVLFTAVALFAVDAPGGWKAAAMFTIVALMIVLWVHARRLDREASSMYAHAVADGTVATAVLDTRREARTAANHPRTSPL